MFEKTFFNKTIYFLPTVWYYVGVYKRVKAVFFVEYGFYAMLFRMKYIKRWGIMHTLVDESLSTHSLEVAFIAHALALIGNRYYKRDYDAQKIAVKAMFHDAPEIFTGDQPTPVKYYSEQTKSAYDSVERAACEKMLAMLPDDLYDEYAQLMTVSPNEKKIIKSADKISAYLKCLEESRLGNREFDIACESLKNGIYGSDMPEVLYFVEHCIAAFDYPIDTLLN